MTSRTPYVPTARDLAKTAEAEKFGVRRTDAPEPGFYAYRFVKTAPEVAARILYEPTRDPETGEALDRSFLWSVTMEGQADLNPSPTPSATCWAVYEFGRRIEEPEYRFLLADRAWARQNRPNSPEAQPRQRVDLRTLDPRLLL